MFAGAPRINEYEIISVENERYKLVRPCRAETIAQGRDARERPQSKSNPPMEGPVRADRSRSLTKSNSARATRRRRVLPSRLLKTTETAESQRSAEKYGADKRRKILHDEVCSGFLSFSLRLGGLRCFSSSSARCL
jgi:hypothetical protein